MSNFAQTATAEECCVHGRCFNERKKDAKTFKSAVKGCKDRDTFACQATMRFALIAFLNDEFANPVGWSLCKVAHSVTIGG